MLTGIGFQWWVLPVGVAAWFAAWFVLWTVVDRNEREMGRADGIVVEQDDGPPRITTLLIGPAALGSRLRASFHPANRGMMVGVL